MDFDIAFDRLIGNEGGYSNDPQDPGGETNWGISKRSYPNVDIARLTRADAKLIYLRDFWTGGQMNQFDGALAFQVFDAAVNHGIRRAIKLLQIAAGTQPDGNVGPVTITTVQALPVSNMLALFVAARLEFWTDLPGWTIYGRGWAKRAIADIRYAVVDYNAEQPK